MGVAARNISGMTLHSALGLNSRSKGTANNKTLSCYLKVLYKFAYNDNTIIRGRLFASPEDAVYDFSSFRGRKHGEFLGGFSLLSSSCFVQRALGRVQVGICLCSGIINRYVSP
jgi:hypothetical protein